jgi:hypothetical protein
MPMSQPKVEKTRPGARSAWGASTEPVVDPVGAPGPPLLLLPAQLAIDPESLAAVVEQVKTAIAEAVRDGVAEGFATAWPVDQQVPVQPETPA